MPGTRLRWEGHAYDDGEKVSRAIESTVTGLTKEIAGVETLVVLDRDFTEGKAEEPTRSLGGCWPTARHGIEIAGIHAIAVLQGTSQMASPVAPCAHAAGTTTCSGASRSWSRRSRSAGFSRR